MSIDQHFVMYLHFGFHVNEAINFLVFKVRVFPFYSLRVVSITSLHLGSLSDALIWDLRYIYYSIYAILIAVICEIDVNQFLFASLLDSDIERIREFLACLQLDSHPLPLLC